MSKYIISETKGKRARQAKGSLPLTYEEMMHEITENYDQLSKKLKQIARYALDHPNDFAIDTIAETAQKADVQPSAMIRFAQAFGFDGFSDVQKLFQQHLLSARPSYAERLASLRGSGTKSSTDLLNQFVETNSVAAELLNQFVESNIVALEHLRQDMKEEKLVQAIELLNKAEVIHIMALRRAFPIASFFFYSVTTMQRRAHLIDNVAGLGQEQQLQIGPKDVLFAASFSGYNPEVINAAKQSMKQGVPVIALTDHLLSPLTINSSVCFHVEDANLHDFRSLGASMCLIQALVAGLGTKKS